MPAKPKLDRFSTAKSYFVDANKIRNHTKDGIRAGPSALLAIVAMWLHCDGRTGVVQMSVTRLATLIGSTRDTARRALAALAELELISPVKRKDGTFIKGRWLVDHDVKPDI